MAYVMLIFMLNSAPPVPIEFAGKVACENAKAIVEHAHNVHSVVCIPKTAPISK
jgi:hypothetical protein